MRKNAGIANKEEAVKRFLQGEKFIWNELKLLFNGDHIMSPFRAVSDSQNESIESAWDYFCEWEIDVDWRDYIGDGVFCRVWNTDINDFHYLIVKEFKKNSTRPYKTSIDDFMCAEPVDINVVEKYIY